MLAAPDLTDLKYQIPSYDFDNEYLGQWNGVGQYKPHT